MNKILEKVKKLRPIDDVFFEKIIEDKAVCEEILRVILEDDELEVLSVIPQSSQKTSGDVRFDWMHFVSWEMEVFLTSKCRRAIMMIM